MNEEKPIEIIFNGVDKKNLHCLMEFVITKIEETQYNKKIYIENKAIWEFNHRIQ